jgi:hypothetical protein
MPSWTNEIAPAGTDEDGEEHLYRTALDKIGMLTQNPMHYADAYRMIRRRGEAGVLLKMRLASQLIGLDPQVVGATRSPNPSRVR